MTDILEAMARAICEASDEPCNLTCPTGAKQDEVCACQMDVWNKEARAALAAFLDATREPSEAMDLAGDDSFQWGGPKGAEWLEAADSTVCWKAMHDKLREEVLGE